MFGLRLGGLVCATIPRARNIHLGMGCMRGRIRAEIEPLEGGVRAHDQHCISKAGEESTDRRGALDDARVLPPALMVIRQHHWPTVGALQLACGPLSGVVFWAGASPFILYTIKRDQSTLIFIKCADFLMAVFDSPAARGELNEQVRELHQLESTVEHFANGVADFSHALGSGAKGLDPRCVWSLLDEAQAPEGQAREAVRDAFEQLGEFGTMLNTQLHNLVLSPLHGYRRSLSAAQARARRFDEESEALDAARLRALGESKDATLELRALAQHQIDVKAAAAEVSWHDTACGLREAAAQRRMLPQKVASPLCPPPPAPTNAPPHTRTAPHTHPFPSPPIHLLTHSHAAHYTSPSPSTKKENLPIRFAHEPFP